MALTDEQIDEIAREAANFFIRGYFKSLAIYGVVALIVGAATLVVALAVPVTQPL